MEDAKTLGAREAQEHELHEACEIREYVGNEPCEPQKQIQHKEHGTRRILWN